jgi:hypothetical protein
MKIPFKVICIHDEERPNDIPTSRWVVKGEEYTVIKVERMNMQGGKLAYELEEINLAKCCFPYTRFGAWRFAIPLSQFATEHKENKRTQPEKAQSVPEEELELVEL